MLFNERVPLSNKKKKEKEIHPEFPFRNPLGFHFPMDPTYSGNKLFLPLYLRVLPQL